MTSSRTTPVRVALADADTRAGRAYGEALRALSREGSTELVALVGPDPVTAAGGRAEAAPGVPRVASLDRLPGQEVDAVIVCEPGSATAQVGEALELGFSVLGPAPLAESDEDVSDLFSTALRQGSLLASSRPERHALESVLDAVEARRIGRVLRVGLQWQSPSRLDAGREPGEEFALREDRMLDLLARHPALVTPPLEVQAIRRLRGFAWPDGAFRSRRTVHRRLQLRVELEHPMPPPREERCELVVRGTHGRITAPVPLDGIDAATAATEPWRPSLGSRDGSTLLGRLAPSRTVAACFERELAAFAARVAAGRTPNRDVVDHERQAMQLRRAVRRSAERRDVETVLR